MESFKQELLEHRAKINEQWLKDAAEANKYLQANMVKFKEKIREGLSNPANWGRDEDEPDAWTLRAPILFPGVSNLKLVDWPDVFDCIKKHLITEGSDLAEVIRWCVSSGDSGEIYLEKKVDLNNLSPAESTIAKYFEEKEEALRQQKAAARAAKEAKKAAAKAKELKKAQKEAAAWATEEKIAAFIEDLYKDLTDLKYWGISRHKYNATPSFYRDLWQVTDRQEILERIVQELRYRAPELEIKVDMKWGNRPTLVAAAPFLTGEEKKFEFTPSDEPLETVVSAAEIKEEEETMTFSKFHKMPAIDRAKYLNIDLAEYESLVESVVRQVRGGQHLRFISAPFRTAKVRAIAYLEHFPGYCCCKLDSDDRDALRYIMDHELKTAEAVIRKFGECKDIQDNKELLEEYTNWLTRN